MTNVRVKVRIRVTIRISCSYINRGVHTPHSLRVTVRMVVHLSNSREAEVP